MVTSAITLSAVFVGFFASSLLWWPLVLLVGLGAATSGCVVACTSSSAWPRVIAFTLNVLGLLSMGVLYLLIRHGYSNVHRVIESLYLY